MRGAGAQHEQRRTAQRPGGHGGLTPHTSGAGVYRYGYNTVPLEVLGVGGGFAWELRVYKRMCSSPRMHSQAARRICAGALTSPARCLLLIDHTKKFRCFNHKVRHGGTPWAPLIGSPCRGILLLHSALIQMLMPAGAPPLWRCAAPFLSLSMPPRGGAHARLKGVGASSPVSNPPRASASLARCPHLWLSPPLVRSRPALPPICYAALPEKFNPGWKPSSRYQAS